MIAEIICVGTELLLGNIVNTNAAFLAKECADLGLSCYYQTVVGDNPERLYQTVKTAIERSDIILLSGGLGPTKDDLTKETVAKLFECPLYLDEVSKRRITEYFKLRGRIPTENTWKQAMIPEGAIVVENENGTAPGVIMEKNGKRVILMPGPPSELQPMFLNSIAPYLKELEKRTIVSVTVKIVGIGEGQAETMVADLMDSQTNPTLAPYAKTCEVHFRVTARADSVKEAIELNQPMVLELQKRFGNNIYTTDVNVSLEQALAEMLLEKKLSMSTAESCTGGLVAARMIKVPGVSMIFKGGFITYADETKQKLVGVDQKTLELYGAVSPQTAEEMARGAANSLSSDVAISITGIAGPDGGTEKKPVGLVYIGCYVKGKVQVQEYHFSGNRMKIREYATATALIQLRNCLLTLEV